MAEYCPNCSKAELALQLLEDAARVASAVRRATPQGAAASVLGSGVDLLLRNQQDRRGEWTGPLAYVDREIDETRRDLREAAESVGKVKRRVSGYQKEFGRQLKKLKKKHPRTKVSALMKRAHRATKKARQ